MKILITAHAVRAGGGRATCINVLHSLGKLDCKNDYLVIVPDQPEYRKLTLPHENFTVHFFKHGLGYLRRIWFDWVGIKRIIYEFQPDLVWAMGGIGVKSPPCPQVVSIQNPYAVYPREHLGKLTLRDYIWSVAMRRAFRKQFPYTDMVICQTPTMEKRLRKECGYRGKTLVTWKAVSVFATVNPETIPKPIAERARAFKLFYVTRYYPHKGLEQLVDLFGRYREDLANCVLFITIEADQHPNALRLLRRIKSLGLSEHIVNLGKIPQEALGTAFQTCDALLMPTLLESFSGTYLEAMHFGTPILTSDLDFAREICADAARYFNPWDLASIRDAILDLRDSPDQRTILKEAGAKRLTEMQKTWPAIVSEVLGSIESIRKKSEATC